MNKLWDETELKWIKTISNSPKSSGHTAQLSISFRNKANIFQKCSLFRQIWCGFVQLSQNLLCRNKTNWSEKVLEEKNPTNTHRTLQELPSFSRCCGDDSLGSLAGKQVSQWHQHQVRWRSVCVRSHPFMCKCVTFQKKPDLNASVPNVFPVRVVKGEATSAANRNNYRNNAPHWEPTSHLSATRWRIITEFVSHTSVDQCLCAVWLNSKTCIHLFNNVLHTSYIRQRRMFTACSDNGLLVSSNVHARPH